MYWNRYDSCDAWYLYAAHYHGGQYSKEYQILGRLHNIGYKPSPLLRYESLSENAKEMYDGLVSGGSRVRVK